MRNKSLVPMMLVLLVVIVLLGVELGLSRVDKRDAICVESGDSWADVVVLLDHGQHFLTIVNRKMNRHDHIELKVVTTYFTQYQFVSPL